MRRNIFKSILIILALSISLVFANANKGITDFINNFAKKFETIESLDQQRKKEVETFILSRQILDFNWMGDFILGKHKKTITEEEINKFIEEYSKFLIRNYLSVLHYYTGDNYKIVSIEKQKNSSIYIVQTTVKYDNDKLIKNNFRIVEKNGKYYITDIITEGISFINAQRSEVNSLITSKGFDKFLEELKTRNATK